MSFLNTNTMYDVLSDVAKQQNSIILEQLNDLITRGLLVVEQGPMTFVREGCNDRITLKQTISLKLKDKEYIETLEAENKELKEKLDKFKELLK